MLSCLPSRGPLQSYQASHIFICTILVRRYGEYAHNGSGMYSWDERSAAVDKRNALRFLAALIHLAAVGCVGTLVSGPSFPLVREAHTKDDDGL